MLPSALPVCADAVAAPHSHRVSCRAARHARAARPVVPLRAAKTGGGDSLTALHCSATDRATLTTDGVVNLTPEEADAEQRRLETTDAFAELVALAAKSSATTTPAQPPSAAKAFSSGGLKKPPWLRQRAPQGDRCVSLPPSPSVK